MKTKLNDDEGKLATSGVKERLTLYQCGPLFMSLNRFIDQLRLLSTANVMSVWLYWPAVIHTMLVEIVLGTGIK